MSDQTRTPAARALSIERRAIRRARYGHAGTSPRALTIRTGADIAATTPSAR